MGEIQARLKETSENCLKAYEGWKDQKKDVKAQEALADAIHEIRKVSSRLEIELALSERDQMTSKPIPIPSHRSNHKKDGSLSDSVAAAKKGRKKQAPAGDDGGAVEVVQSKPRRRRTPKKDDSAE